MKRIITGQKIRVDNHKRVQKSEFKGLHIHKTVLKKKINIEILIPFESASEIIIRPKHVPRTIKETELNKVLKELNSVLSKDSDKRQIFINEIVKAIDNFSENNEKIENIRTSIKALAKHFDLNPEIIEEIQNYSNTRLKSITTIHREVSGSHLFYIFQSNKIIEIGELTKNSSIYKFLKKV